MRGIRRARPPGSAAPEGAEQESLERASPGLAALFDRLSDDGRHALLDLGPAEGHQLRLLGRFGRQIRFAGIIPLLTPAPWSEVIASLAPNPGLPYDVVLAWDVLDRVGPEEREGLIARLADITAPGALLYAVVDASGSVTTRPLSFTLVELGRVRQRPAGPPAPAREPILPAQVERALQPFGVIHAFTLRSGLREYVARKGG
jgi:Methyltransferase domain